MLGGMLSLALMFGGIKLEGNAEKRMEELEQRVSFTVK
jgi:hypothetical protein